MTTIYLKFADEAEAIAMLADYRGVDENGNPFWKVASIDHALDVIGTIYEPTGVMLQADMLGSIVEYPEMAPIPGFHVNFVGDLPMHVMPCCVEPVTPYRVFA